MANSTISDPQPALTGGLFSRHRHSITVVGLLIRRELKVKYRGSVLGYLWSMLNPLLFMIIISFVFSRLMRGIEHYELFVLSGILFWNMTAQSIAGGTSSFVHNAGLLQKVRVPFWIFAIVPLGSALVNLILAIVPYLAIVWYRGLTIPGEIVFLPLFLILYSIFLSGLTLSLSTMNVFFRDVSHVVDPILQLLFYATPIIYDRHNPAIPENIATLLGYNPLARFVELFRESVFRSSALDWKVVSALCVLSVVSLIIGSFIHSRYRDRLIFKL